jgi:hypothetical protein
MDGGSYALVWGSALVVVLRAPVLVESYVAG